MKKRISKRILSTLLVLVMVLSALPMAAMAAEFKGIDVDDDGVNDVNVAFGAELDPSNVLTQYDIKAVGAVVMDYVGGDRKAEASGEVELYVPFSLFEDTIDDTIDDKLSSALAEVVDPAVQEYEDRVADYLEEPISFTDDFEVEIYPDPSDEDICIEELTISVDVSNLAELIELIRSGKYPVEYNGISYGEFYYYEIFGDADDALREMVNYATTKVLKVSKLTGDAYENWLTAAADPDEDADALAESLVAVLGLKYAQEKYTNTTVRMLIANIPLDNNGVFKNSTQIAAELKTEIKEDVTNMVDGYVEPLLNDIKASFYGPLAAGETLTDRFDALQDIIDAFIDDISEDFADYGAAGLSSVSIPLPTDRIGSVEGMLKSVVAKVNGTDAANEEISGAIIGSKAADELAARSTTGMYVVAGVSSADTSDMKYEAFVIAPDVVPVTIKADGADKGYFMHYTVGDDYEITSSVPAGYDADNLMKLRIAGVETDGGTYDSAEEPANAGVYTVFSFYFDKETMAMGGDVAVLVVEPQDTLDAEFSFNDDLTVSYDGNGHFPEITNTNKHMSVSIAADQNNADVYVMLPDNFGDTVGAYTDRAEDILARIESETENVGLPLPEQITAKILGALTALDNYANAAEGPGKVTNEQIKDRLNNYLTAVKDLYSTETLVEKAGNVVDKVKEVLKTNPTIQGYKDLIKSAWDEFKAFKNDQSASTFAMRRSTMSNEERIAREFVNRFMDEADVNEDDVRALLSYVADYADNSSYKQDAITLIKTLGVIGKVETDKVNAAVDNVDAAFDVLKADVKAKLIEINNRADKVPTKADAKEVLGYVETFIKAVEEQAKAVVKAFTVQNIYFGTEPSAIGVYDCYAVNVSANYVPNLTTATLTIVESKYVCMNVEAGVYYTDLSDALKDVNDPAAETIRMLKDYKETYVVIAPGTTLDLADYTVTAKFVAGMNGSKLTANPNSGKLVAPKANVTLAQEGYKNAKGQYILPIWDPTENCYQFTQFVLNTDNDDRGLFIDEANEEIYFQFKHQATGAINRKLLSDGASDNAMKVIVRLVWETSTGSAHQDFFYTDNFVGQTTGAFDYNFKLIGYSAMDIHLDTLSVTAMTITDSGVVACGETWDISMDKNNG